MTTVYIIRHAEAEGNLYRRAHGWYDSLVTERGRRQIAALAGRFEHIPVDAVYSSDLRRTMTTAQAIYQTHGLELRTDSGLREMHLGEWEDVPWGDLAYRDGARLAAFNATAPEFQAPAGESYAQTRARLAEAVRRIAAAHPGQTVAIFSHGTAIRCLQGEAHGLAPEELASLGHADNTAVTCIEAEGGALRVVFENDATHLPREISTLAGQSWWKGGGADLNLRYRPLDMDRECDIYCSARREAWVSIHGGLDKFDGEGFVQNARAQWKRDPRAVTAAFWKDELVGLLQMDTARDADRGAGYLPFYYMTPDWRKRGLGVQLLGEAVSVYRPMGRDRLRLRCAPDNYVAQRFYRRYGFRKVAEAEGTRVPLDIMEKYIGYEDN